VQRIVVRLFGIEVTSQAGGEDLDHERDRDDADHSEAIEVAGDVPVRESRSSARLRASGGAEGEVPEEDGTADEKERLDDEGWQEIVRHGAGRFQARGAISRPAVLRRAGSGHRSG
jgi:hypothetical protein